jgi:hypothetical protein
VPSNGHKQQKAFWLEFLYLWGTAVIIGGVSSWLIHFPPVELQRELLIPFHPRSTAALLIALFVQGSIHLAIVIGIGLLAAHRLGLGARILEAWLRRESVRPYLSVALIPIVLTILLIVGCTIVSNSSMLHPNRKQATIAATEIVNSPVSARLNEEIEKLGFGAIKPYTHISLPLSYLDGAISGGLVRRLFQVSVIALLFAQIFSKSQIRPDRKFLWAAILIVAVVHTAFDLWMRHENTTMISAVYKTFGFQLTVDPYWLVMVRTSIPILPPSVAFGWLYSRYGIESAIVASFCGALMASWFLDFVLIHFAL